MGCRGDATHQKPNQLISNAVFERTIVARIEEYGVFVIVGKYSLLYLPFLIS